MHGLAEYDSRNVNKAHFVNSPFRRTQTSPESTSASAPGSWVCGTKAFFELLPAAACTSGRRFAT